jgi:hypothetical protein
MKNLSTNRKVVTVISLLLALFFLYRRRGSFNASTVVVLTDFSAIDGRIFSQRKRNRRPVLDFEPLGDTFVIHEDHQGSHPILRHSLHARLNGPHGQQYSCFLARSEDNTHHCPTAVSLEPGEWNVNITLVRSPVKKQRRQCRPNKTAFSKISNASGSKSLNTFSVIDYILAGDFPTFESFRRCFKYPYESILQTKWIKIEETDKNAVAKRNKNQEICQGPGGPGTWIAHSKPCSITNICQGEISDDIKYHKSNIERGIEHIFKPFTCRPQFYDKNDARTCALDNSITLAGDSRTLHLVIGFQQWLGQDAVQFIPLYRPYRLGLTHAWSQPSGAQLRKAIRSGKAVLINSVLHDVAEFFSTTTAEDVMKAWSKYVDCSSERCSGKLALECGCRKQWAIKAYLTSINALRDDIIAAREDALKDKNAPEPKVFWVSLNKRPPSPPDVFFDWQTADIVKELEDRASMELEKAGVVHIDLRWMTGAAPEQWWDDPVHFGKEKKSMFLHGTLHAILSQVCR